MPRHPPSLPGQLRQPTPARREAHPNQGPPAPTTTITALPRTTAHAAQRAMAALPPSSPATAAPSTAGPRGPDMAGPGTAAPGTAAPGVAAQSAWTVWELEA